MSPAQNRDDFDPFGGPAPSLPVSPIITSNKLVDKGGIAFHSEFNAKGPFSRTFAEGVRRGRGDDNEICLELTSKKRADRRLVIPQIAESIAFWAPISTPGEC